MLQYSFSQSQTVNRKPANHKTPAPNGHANLFRDEASVVRVGSGKVRDRSLLDEFLRSGLFTEEEAGGDGAG